MEKKGVLRVDRVLYHVG
jgi:hypothetical protein